MQGRRAQARPESLHAVKNLRLQISIDYVKAVKVPRSLPKGEVEDHSQNMQLSTQRRGPERQQNLLTSTHRTIFTSWQWSPCFATCFWISVRQQPESTTSRSHETARLPVNHAEPFQSDAILNPKRGALQPAALQIDVFEKTETASLWWSKTLNLEATVSRPGGRPSVIP